MNNLSILWEQKQRVGSMWFQTFFDICGFFTVSRIFTAQMQDETRKTPECGEIELTLTQDGTVLIRVPGTADEEYAGCLDAGEMEPVELLCEVTRILLQKGAVTENDRQAMDRIARLYSMDITRDIYTIRGLYQNRKVVYQKTEMIKNAVNGLVNFLADILADTEEEPYRICYSMAYVSDLINEGLYKLRGDARFLSDKLLELTGRALKGSPELHTVYLLNISILLNTRELNEKVVEACNRAIENLDGIARSMSEFYLGEVLQQEDEKNRLLLYKEATGHYVSCLKDNPDEIRAMYKLAMQHERRWGLINKNRADDGEFKQAREQYNRIIETTRKIDGQWCNTVEIEYTYKAHFRIAQMYRYFPGEDRILQQYKRCEEVWDYLKDNRFLKGLYGPDLKGIEECLADKYSGVKEIIIKKKNKLLQSSRQA